MRERFRLRSAIHHVGLQLVRSGRSVITLVFLKGRHFGSAPGVVPPAKAVGGGPSRITPRTWSTDTDFHGNATRPQVAPAAAQGVGLLPGSSSMAMSKAPPHHRFLLAEPPELGGDLGELVR